MKWKKWAKELKFKLVLEGLQGDTPILHRTFGKVASPRIAVIIFFLFTGY